MGLTTALNGFADSAGRLGLRLTSVLLNRCGASVGTGGGGLSGVTVPWLVVSVAALMLVWYCVESNEPCTQVSCQQTCSIGVTEAPDRKLLQERSGTGIAELSCRL